MPRSVEDDTDSQEADRSYSLDLQRGEGSSCSLIVAALLVLKALLTSPCHTGCEQRRACCHGWVVSANRYGERTETTDGGEHATRVFCLSYRTCSC